LTLKPILKWMTKSLRMAPSEPTARNLPQRLFPRQGAGSSGPNSMVSPTVTKCCGHNLIHGALPISQAPRRSPRQATNPDDQQPVVHGVAHGGQGQVIPS
jgi:hypothetical protein